MDTVQAVTDYATLTDTEGRLVLLPAATVEHFRKRGAAAITLTIPLDDQAVDDGGWLTVTEAARLHVDDVDGMNLAAARTKISRACDAGRIVSIGECRRRRIEPKDFAAWRLHEREKNLDRADRDRLT
jgi:hypothetical protein